MSTQEKPIREGYQLLDEGYQPTQSNLNPSNPPQGGTGLPSNAANTVSSPNSK